MKSRFAIIGADLQCLRLIVCLFWRDSLPKCHQIERKWDKDRRCWQLQIHSRLEFQQCRCPQVLHLSSHSAFELICFLQTRNEEESIFRTGTLSWMTCFQSAEELNRTSNSITTNYTLRSPLPLFTVKTREPWNFTSSNGSFAHRNPSRLAFSSVRNL